MVCKEEGTGTSDINVYDTVTVSGNSVPIDSTATVYKFSSGLELIVPPGAVKENVTVSFELLDSISAGQIIPLDVFAGNVFCAGISFGQTGTKFLKPVKIRVPALNYQHKDIPFVYLYNSVSSSWTQFTGPLSCSENEHFIEFSTDTPLSARIELFKNVLGFGKSNAKSANEEIDCHKILVKIVSDDYHYIGQLATGTCQVINQTLSVEFTACTGKPIETAKIQEIAKACEPIVKCTPDKSCLNKNESATLNFEVTVGGLALSDQQIYITLPAGLTSTQNPVFATDKDGKAEFTVTCNVDNYTSGTINYDVHTQYYYETVEASAEGASEISHGEGDKKRTEEIHESLTIRSCSAPTSINISQPKYWELSVGGTWNLNPVCSPGKCGKLEYVIEDYPFGNSGIVSIDDNGIVTALKPGVVYIKASSSGIESNIVGLSVAYQGYLVLNKTLDWNLYDEGCGCAQDWEQNHNWNMYVMNYTGTIGIKFWLNIDKNNVAIASLEGSQVIIYNIKEPSFCKDTTIYQVLRTSEYWSASENTQSIVQGTPFDITIPYDYWPALSDFSQIVGATPLVEKITVYGSMSSASEVSINSISFIPEGCVDRVSGSCILH